MVTAIETHYKGYRFRSRLEARWAVFFQTLGFRWEYEEQGFKLLPGVCYLPDFKLILPNENIVYCEVKPSEEDEHESEEIDNMRLFSNGTGKPILLLSGPPEYRPYHQFIPGLENKSFTAAFFQDYDPYVETCDSYWYNLVEMDERTGKLFFPFDDRRARKAFGQKLVDAVKAARSARFEFGEQPD